ncbi:unnamed protein product [Eruca vesicaria subsp. sativa]|uniref:Rab-GAP TBC domain-containing protein n=1 Tax=Eruca vesicaria subsp. sativa TaxID=29727 RepID=A0ABC8M2U8_ERUVS|nr:unnamed protein product [Eruca vesicaria subsp. sativa]
MTRATPFLFVGSPLNRIRRPDLSQIYRLATKSNLHLAPTFPTSPPSPPSPDPATPLLPAVPMTQLTSTTSLPHPPSTPSSAITTQLHSPPSPSTLPLPSPSLAISSPPPPMAPSRSSTLNLLFSSSCNDLAIHPSGKLASAVSCDECFAMLNLVKGKRSFCCSLGHKASLLVFIILRISSKGASENDSEDEFYDVERSDSQDSLSSDGTTVSGILVTGDVTSFSVSTCPWKEELEMLIRGGVPMALRGELWQAFVGVKKRRRKDYYQNLLAEDSSGNNIAEEDTQHVDEKGSNTESLAVVEKWKGQKEKVVPYNLPRVDSLYLLVQS